MTIEKIKAEISLKYGYQDWTALLRNNIDKKAIHIQKYIDEAIEMALEAKIITSKTIANDNEEKHNYLTGLDVIYSEKDYEKWIREKRKVIVCHCEQPQRIGSCNKCGGQLK